MQLYLSLRYVFNDPIHGTVELHPLLIKIIDTPQFQRLRNIKQLGGAYFVYPGASHNRFEHSIGVGHLAGQLVEALRTRQPELDINDRDVLCVKIAGLCHDLGHGPFSHLYDQMFIPKVPHPPGPLGDKMAKWKHEEASVEMFDHLVEFTNLKLEMKKVMKKRMEKEENDLKLENEADNWILEDLNFIKKMIEGLKDPKAVQVSPWPYCGRPKDKSFLFEIVANKTNGIDVDKFDYFARDCYHLGMQNNFDHLRFIQFARVIKVKKDELNHICLYGSNSAVFHSVCLVDHVFEQILNSPSVELAEAKKILERIISRDHYRFLGETKPRQVLTRVCINVFEKILGWKEELDQMLLSSTGLLGNIKTDFSLPLLDPIKNVYFYSKRNPNTAFNIPRDQVSKLLPACFSEQLIRVYSKKKKTDEQSLEAARRHLIKWCKAKGLPNPQAGTKHATSTSRTEPLYMGSHSSTRPPRHPGLRHFGLNE
uniref:HD/PDEase domain-containing protein n=1 Tax=Sander lucioperca TaxID=283035 RepID=A0A8C9YEV6_SANLU